jgi:hypothetical protein
LRTCHNRPFLLWDLSLVAGTMLAIAYPTVRVLKLREHRPAVAQMAATLVERQADRVALPISMRPEAPQLLRKGITPVLYDPTRTASQQFALLNVTYQIGVNPPSLTRLDLERLRFAPIAPGHSIREEFSRPHIYSPIQPSFKLTPDVPLERPIFLARGCYELNLEVFFRKNSPQPTISVQVTVGGAPSVRNTFVAQRVVHPPAVVPFDVQPRGGDATLTITSSSTAFIHAWEIEAK